MKPSHSIGFSSIEMYSDFEEEGGSIAQNSPNMENVAPEERAAETEGFRSNIYSGCYLERV